MEQNISEDEAKRIERHIQNKIDYLKDSTEGYKTAVNVCDPAKLSSYTWTIATQTGILNEIKGKLTTTQKDQFEKLQRDYVQQLRKLEQGHCKCKPLE